MKFKYFFLLVILIMFGYNTQAQKYVILGNLIPYNRDFKTSICLLSERIPTVEQDYATRDKSKSSIYLIDSSLLNDLCSYIAKNGKILSYYRDGGPESIYQVVINTDGLFQPYFEFYNKKEVVTFYEALIAYLNQKHGIKNVLRPILENERSKYLGE